MLLGKDDVILNVCPAYETDALLRKVNVDRYDDRKIVRTNLIESYDQLMEFAQKHLLDKFFLEDTENVSLRNVLAREMLGNTLMHREYTSSYAAKFVIEKDRMYVENANRATREGTITPENLEPNPKNPIIASFFRSIGRADRLGSGVRKLFKYSKYYSGQEPQFMEGDVFRIVVPLDDSYSFEFGQNGSDQSNQYNTDRSLSFAKVNGKVAKKSDEKKVAKKSGEKKVTKKTQEKYDSILKYMQPDKWYKASEFESIVDVKESRVKVLLRDMVEQGLLESTGSTKGKMYKISKQLRENPVEFRKS
jgi:ATP-dependent DNA helicase RecG